MSWDSNLCWILPIVDLRWLLWKMSLNIFFKIPQPILIKVFNISFGLIFSFDEFLMGRLKIFRASVDIKTAKDLTEPVNYNRVIMNQMWRTFFDSMKIQFLMVMFFVFFFFFNLLLVSIMFRNLLILLCDWSHDFIYILAVEIFISRKQTFTTREQEAI